MCTLPFAVSSVTQTVSFFEMCNSVLSSGGKVILHLGRTSKIDMAKELSMRATKWFDVVYCAGENVKQIERHGIKDKGNTIEHQYLFLQKNEADFSLLHLQYYLISESANATQVADSAVAYLKKSIPASARIRFLSLHTPSM